MAGQPCGADDGLGTAGAAAPAFGERCGLQGVTAAPWAARVDVRGSTALTFCYQTE